MKIYRILILCLCGVMLLGTLVGCSNQVLLPDGQIITAGQTTAPDTQANPSDTKPTQNGSLTLDIETIPDTTPSISIGGSDPEEMFKNSPHVMHAEFLNTGESDCILIRMDDKVILVDTADTDDTTKIKNKLQSYEISTIDYLIITHYDNDHIGAISALLNDFAVGQVYMPDYVRDSGLYRGMMSALQEKVVAENIHRISEDVNLDLGYGRLWLNTSKVYEAGLTLGNDQTSTIVENDYSIIASVYFGDVSMLLTGDAEEARLQEFNALFEEGAYPDYMLVKTPHHGSYFKNMKTCLDATRPRFCVVCTDTQDKVEAGLVTAMRGSGASIYYTFGGDVMFSTDGSATKYLMTQK